MNEWTSEEWLREGIIRLLVRSGNPFRDSLSGRFAARPSALAGSADGPEQHPDYDLLTPQESNKAITAGQRAGERAHHREYDRAIKQGANHGEAMRRGMEAARVASTKARIRRTEKFLREGPPRSTRVANKKLRDARLHPVRGRPSAFEMYKYGPFEPKKRGEGREVRQGKIRKATPEERKQITVKKWEKEDIGDVSLPALRRGKPQALVGRRTPATYGPGHTVVGPGGRRLRSGERIKLPGGTKGRVRYGRGRDVDLGFWRLRQRPSALAVKHRRRVKVEGPQKATAEQKAAINNKLSPREQIKYDVAKGFLERFPDREPKRVAVLLHDRNPAVYKDAKDAYHSILLALRVRQRTHKKAEKAREARIKRDREKGRSRINQPASGTPYFSGGRRNPGESELARRYGRGGDLEKKVKEAATEKALSCILR